MTTYVFKGFPQGTSVAPAESQNTLEPADSLETIKLTSNWHKFTLLLWKNWLLQRRHKIQTLVEILAPVLFSIILVLIRSLVDPVVHAEPTHFKAVDLKPLSKFVTLKYKVDSIAYSPYNPTIRAIMEVMSTNMDGFAFLEFENSSSLARHLINGGNDTIGFEFSDSYAQMGGNITNFTVAFRYPPTSLFGGKDLFLRPSRWYTNMVFSPYPMPGPRSKMDDGGYPPGYNNEGFLTLQHQLTLAILEYFNENALKNVPTLNLHQFPYPNYIEDPLLTALQGFVAMIFMLSFSYTCISIVRMVTAEKEKQIKEAMKIMGLPNWLHWTAWFVKGLSFTLVSTLLITFLVTKSWHKNVAVFTYASPVVVFLLLMLYMCATITFSFMISVCFSKANTAAAIAGFLWFVTYSPYVFLQPRYDDLTFATKIGVSLFHNTAMSFGFQLVLAKEGSTEGMQLNNIFTPISLMDTLTLGHVFLMLIVDTIVYLVIAIYIEQIFPGDYGFPKPWYFPFTINYWFPRPEQVDLEDKRPSTSVSDFETEPSELRAGIRIRNLFKVYGKTKTAVTNLSLNMYEDQITVLLGHNGAGKTTTMGILTGMIPPSSGTAYVYGYDLRKDLPTIRMSLGLCPQHNVLFDELTVKEHLYFFGRLKGLNPDKIEEEITRYLKLLQLEPKANSASSTLSGGMKRKLSVGVALCGGSKVVMLDEPTSGMDPSARRALWELLKSEKKGRTILLTTHFMDEADLLGDRIAIMAAGQLRCCGSSYFLKKHFGTGYHLIMDKKQTCDINRITELLAAHVPGITPKSNIGSELSYILNDGDVNRFEAMLKDLEQNSEMLGVNSYGISLTTLEDVFMKVGSSDLVRDENTDNGKAITKGNGHTHSLSDASNSPSTMIDIAHMPKTPLLHGTKLFYNQLRTLIKKKVLYTWRSWQLFAIQILLSVVFLVIAIMVVRSWQFSTDLPALPITLKTYPNCVTILDAVKNGNKSGMDTAFVKYYRKVNERYCKVKAMDGDDMDKFVLKEFAVESVPAVRKSYIVGATISSQNFTAWFNNEPFHSTALSVNLLDNVLLKSLIGDEFEVNVINKPLPYDLAFKIDKLRKAGLGFQLAFNTCATMAFVSSFYLLFCSRERVSKAKHLQIVSGAKILTFWIANYLWDLTTFLATVASIIVTFIAFQEDGFKTFAELGRVGLILTLFGISMLPMMYLCSMIFESPSTGFTRMVLVNILVSNVATVVVEILALPNVDLLEWSKAMETVFLSVPHFALGSAMRNFDKMHTSIKFCHEYCNLFPGIPESLCFNMACALTKQCCPETISGNYFSWTPPGCGRNVAYLLASCLIFITLLLIIEYRIHTRIMYLCQRTSKLPNELIDLDDDDVAREKLLVRNNLTPNDLPNYGLVLKDMTKVYGKDFVAVNRVCLAINKNDCFGLLGINGAGKTSTFKMLTGDTNITCGDAWVKGLSIKSEMNNVLPLIGYCPQFDALLNELTVRETLHMFCLLRGINWTDKDLVSDYLATALDFEAHYYKKIRQLSGGNRRKVSTAVAIISDPSVVYLDEPTTGMDPATKRHLWNFVCQIRDSGHCVVLTSHSMEECEALCTKIAIMVNGTFKCLGSVQHLKTKFAAGFTITVKVSRPRDASGQTNTLSETDDATFIANMNNVKQFVKEQFTKAILREEYNGLLTYYVSDDVKTWSEMFGVMQQGKVTMSCIEDYSLGQCSLEQVFLSFTKNQQVQNE